METSFKSKLLRLVLSVSIIFTSAHAFGAETQTGGGGGKPPPPPPPVDIGDGGDLANPGGKGGKGEGDASIRSGRFMETYGVTQDGKTIYFEGQRDARGRVRVYKYASPDPRFISRGVLVRDATHPDGIRTQWLRGGGTIEGLRAELAAKENPPAPEPVRPEPTRPVKHYLLDPVQTTSEGSQTEKAYHQGRKDRFNRELIFRPTTAAGKPNYLLYQTGFIDQSGRFQWNTETTAWETLVNELSDANKGSKGRQEQTERIDRLRESLRNEELSRAQNKNPLEIRTISPHSNYPAQATPAEPIPPSRALVPAGPRIDLPVRNGPGISEVNAPGVEYLPEFDSENKPSQLNRKRTAEETKFLKEQLSRMMRGLPNTLVGSSPDSLMSKTYDSTLNFAKDLPRGAAGFYIGLGMATALVLYTDYANNPAAWNTYVSSMSGDQIASLAAFMAVAGGSYWAMQRMSVKMLGPDAMSKGFVHRPIAVGSLAVAGLTMTILSEIIADPNFAKCTGLNKLKNGGFPFRDYNFCDKLWETWSSNQHWNNMAVNQLIPMFINMVVAGGIWQASLIGTSYLLSRQAIATGLRSIRFGFGSQGGSWQMRLLGMGINVAVFLGAYYISERWFQAGRWAREEMTDTWSFSNDPHGASIQQTEQKLLEEWVALKKSGFKDPDKFDRLCVDSTRKYNVFYNCEEPDRLKFMDLLNKYADFQKQWRRIKLTDAENAYKQWRVKSDNYYAMLEVSYDFYRLMMLNPGRLNRESVKNFMKLEDKHAHENWKMVKDLNFDGVWKYLTTYDVGDYLVASMACGPEAEGYGQNANSGLFGGVGSFVTNFVTGNTTPQQMINDSKGWKIRFNPPRITHPLAKDESVVCQTGGYSRLIPLTSPNRTAPHNFPVKTDRGSYNNLYEYINAEIRPNVIEKGENHFADWWERFITPPSDAIDKKLRADYEKLLSTEYLRAISDNQYKRCNPSRVRDTGLEKYLKLLAKSDDPCPAEAMDKLAQGHLRSLRDEMRLYLAMLLDLKFSNPVQMGEVGMNSQSEAEQTVIDRAVKMMAVMDKFLEGTKDIEAAKRVNLIELNEIWFILSETMKIKSINQLALPSIRTLDPRLKAIGDQMNVKLAELTSAPKSARESLKLELQQLSSDYERLEKSIPPQAPTVFQQNVHLTRWALALNLKINSVYRQASDLYRILTLFEK